MAEAEETPDEETTVEETKKVPDGTYLWGTGRRKSSVARVRVRPGSGQIVVNGKDYLEYFPDLNARNIIDSPLRAIDGLKSFEIRVNVNGGGYTGQAGAIRMGIARALIKFDSQYEDPLKAGNFLTRDSRMKERKKYGLAGARRAFQFSKR